MVCATSVPDFGVEPAARVAVAQRRAGVLLRDARGFFLDQPGLDLARGQPEVALHGLGHGLGDLRRGHRRGRRELVGRGGGGEAGDREAGGENDSGA